MRKKFGLDSIPETHGLRNPPGLSREGNHIPLDSHVWSAKERLAILQNRTFGYLTMHPPGEKSVAHRASLNCITTLGYKDVERQTTETHGPRDSPRRESPAMHPLGVAMHKELNPEFYSSKLDLSIRG